MSTSSETRKEYMKEYLRRYRASHKEEIRVYRSEYYRSHQEELLEYGRQWYDANREDRLRRSQQRYQDRPEDCKIGRRRRRALELNASGSHTAEDVRAQYNIQEGRCFYCASELTAYHVDHYVPLALGGTDNKENIVLACPRCNFSKGAMPPEVFKKRLKKEKPETAEESTEG